MTRFQVKKATELKANGWTIIPPPQTPARPGGTIKVQNVSGEIFDVQGDGSLKKAQ